MIGGKGFVSLTSLADLVVELVDVLHESGRDALLSWSRLSLSAEILRLHLRWHSRSISIARSIKRSDMA